MPLQARRCHVALSGFCGPCGQVSEEAAGAGVMVAVRVARFLTEAVGAGVMVASMIRVVMDLRRLYVLQSWGPEVRQFVHSSLYGRHTFHPVWTCPCL